MTKKQNENLGPNKYAPKDRFKTNMPINSKTGAFMEPRRFDSRDMKMKKIDNVDEDTDIKPDKSDSREEKIKVSELDIDMFQNIVRDLGRLSHVTSALVDDIDSNKGKHYDDYVMKLKRAFEPLVVTIQRLPDSKSDLGKDGGEDIEQAPENSSKIQPEEGPQDGINNIEKKGDTELDKAVEKDKQGDEVSTDDNMKKNTLKESKGYVDKVALKNRRGRIIWVKRKYASKYISKKGYTLASGVVKRSDKKKSSKPKRAIKKLKMNELYTGSGTHNIMSQDKQELIDDDKNMSKRIIMRGKDGNTYAVRHNKVQACLDKGFKLEKDTITQMPKTLTVNESEINRISKDEYNKVINEIISKEIKSLKKRNEFNSNI